jgi:hypothetical protein
MVASSILWRRLVGEGHEAARLEAHPSGWLLSGNAVFAESEQPCSLDYQISCDQIWHTRSAQVMGWVGGARIALTIAVDPQQRWWLNGTECPAVAGCLDIDLNFSPSTNLLPIRRLALEVGQRAPVRAAWLRFPSFVLEPLEQDYHRLDATTYRYSSAGGAFVADITVGEDGFARTYANFWEAVIR